MKKKIFTVGLLLFMVFGMFSTKTYSKVEPGTPYYQTMSYCGSWTMKWACTTQTTSNRCSYYYCLINY